MCFVGISCVCPSIQSLREHVIRSDYEQLIRIVRHKTHSQGRCGAGGGCGRSEDSSSLPVGVYLAVQGESTPGTGEKIRD